MPGRIVVVVYYWRETRMSTGDVHGYFETRWICLVGLSRACYHFIDCAAATSYLY